MDDPEQVHDSSHSGGSDVEKGEGRWEEILVRVLSLLPGAK